MTEPVQLLKHALENTGSGFTQKTVEVVNSDGTNLFMTAIAENFFLIRGTLKLNKLTDNSYGNAVLMDNLEMNTDSTQSCLGILDHPEFGSPITVKFGIGMTSNGKVRLDAFANVETSVNDFTGTFTGYIYSTSLHFKN